MALEPAAAHAGVDVSGALRAGEQQPAEAAGGQAVGGGPVGDQVAASEQAAAGGPADDQVAASDQAAEEQQPVVLQMELTNSLEVRMGESWERG